MYDTNYPSCLILERPQNVSRFVWPYWITQYGQNNDSESPTAHEHENFVVSTAPGVAPSGNGTYANTVMTKLRPRIWGISTWRVKMVVPVYFFPICGMIVMTNYIDELLKIMWLLDGRCNEKTKWHKEQNYRYHFVCKGIIYVGFPAKCVIQITWLTSYFIHMFACISLCLETYPSKMSVGAY